jgi:sugar phosphate isomerase/epimerase
VGSFAFGWAAGEGGAFDELALLAFARRHDVAVVQVGDNMAVHTWSPERLDRFVRQARAQGSAIELGARGLTDEHLARYLPLCDRCGAGLLRFVADTPEYEPSPGHLVALLRNAAAALEQAGVVLALENHDRFAAGTLRRIVEDAASPHVGVCLDTANSFGAGEGLAAVTDVLAPVTVNLHVKDVRIARLPHMMGFIVQGTPLGEGQLPVRWAVEQVASFGRCMTAIVETWTSPVEQDLAATIAREAESADIGIERLKQWLAAPGNLLGVSP